MQQETKHKEISAQKKVKVLKKALVKEREQHKQVIGLVVSLIQNQENSELLQNDVSYYLEVVPFRDQRKRINRES